MDKPKIGFLSYWGIPRGQAYVTRYFYNALKDIADIYILKQGVNKNDSDFPTPEHIVTYPSYFIDKEFFIDWVESNQLDYVVFNEYNQWFKQPDCNLIDVCNELDVRPIGYLVQERFDVNEVEEYKKYFRILSPSKSFLKTLRQNKIYRAKYVPVGFNADEYSRDKMSQEPMWKSNLTFLHIGGAGGVHERKNTEVVIEAFKKLYPDAIDAKDKDCLLISSDKARLVVTSQHIKNLSRPEYLNYLYNADVVVLPSKWETIGIPILEAFMCNKPVITTDSAPMNEFVINNVNGLLVPVDRYEDYKEVICQAALVSVEELAKKMKFFQIEDIKETLTKNVAKSKEEFLIENTKKYLLEAFE